MTSKSSTPVSIEEKLAKARREGRIQTALELARQLAKEAPNPAHQQLLRDVAVERGEQLLRDGKDKEAAVVFGNALKMGPDADAQARIGGRLAQAGDFAGTTAILERLADGPARSRLIGHLADAAILRNQRDRLAPDLHAGFDSIVHAFARYERGQDAEALDTLQAIGLKSPYLEWRVLLRGLSAFSRGEDAKALENWQRLDPDRLPWRLVAPFRFRIDPDFAAAQPAETVRRLSGQLDKCDPGLGAKLRSIDQAIHKEEKPAKILDRIEEISVELRERHPTLMPKLVRTMYGVFLHHGTQNDLERMMRLLPPLADDPNHHLLWALSSVERDYWLDAMDRFVQYDHSLVREPRILGDETPLARALIWERLGDLALKFGSDPPRIRGDKKPLTAERCYRTSIDLVPTRRPAYQKLALVYNDSPGMFPKAVATAYEFVERFPNEAEAWSMLGAAAEDKKDFAEAERCYAEAVRSDPLEPIFRAEWESAVWKRVNAATVKEARKRKPDMASLRMELERAVASAGLKTAARLAEWAMLEHRAGNPDFAGELRTRAMTRPGDRLAAPIAFHLVAGTIPKFDPATKAEFAAALDAAFEMPPTFDEVMAAVAVLDAWDPPIKGRPAVFKRFYPLVKEALDRLSEQQTIALGEALYDAIPTTSMRIISFAMRERWPEAPELWLLAYDIRCDGGAGHGPMANMLDKAASLAAELPRDRQQRILEEVQARRAEMPALSDLASMMLDFMEQEGIDL